MQLRRRRALIAAIAVLLLIVLPWLACRGEDRTGCMRNLLNLGQTLLSMPDDEQQEAKKLRGVSMLLAWRKSGRIDERLLRCPVDPDLRALDDAARGAYDGVDLANPPDDLCSYAVRDFERFPFPSDGSEQKEILACCRNGRDGRTSHHRGGGVIVLFGEGDVQWMTPEQLGFAPGEAIVVGPGSKSELLKKVIQLPAR